ncbi:MAG: glycoside hydrolase family 73 protein [Candidatus Omnitrophica bacterium]|nr:glycoside hydrolase family 73 protein [Candidatus Omnitrophota bacterium]MDD5353325.1 glycoside hydrolase family 73 protein [Candidatus Omnitrophota bacterium]MDD5551407.1 glycoside hydrolase family 73 protein [Candidatus Omnitrophota bacterium]
MTSTEFIEKNKDFVLAACKDTTLLPSVFMAQAILESNWGKSELAKNHNNYFGIKPGGAWKGRTATFPTQEYINGKWVVVEAAFRSYDKPEDSFFDRVNFLKQRSRYDRVFKANTPLSQATELYLAGYATDPSYPRKINQIINQHNLTALDGIKKK